MTLVIAALTLVAAGVYGVTQTGGSDPAELPPEPSTPPSTELVTAEAREDIVFPDHLGQFPGNACQYGKIGRAVQQECRDR